MMCEASSERDRIFGIKFSIHFRLSLQILPILSNATLIRPVLASKEANYAADTELSQGVTPEYPLPNQSKKEISICNHATQQIKYGNLAESLDTSFHQCLVSHTAAE